METLNRPRLLYVLNVWVNHNYIPDINEANFNEPLFFGPAFISGEFRVMYFIQVNYFD